MDKRQFERITQWQLTTFGPDQSVVAKLEHLLEEMKELVHDIETDAPGKKSEWADCFILLFGAAKADGMEYNDICNCIDDKMHINYNRKWDAPKANGVINHVREGGMEIEYTDSNKTYPDLTLEWQPPIYKIESKMGPFPMCWSCKVTIDDTFPIRWGRSFVCSPCELDLPF